MFTRGGSRRGDRQVSDLDRQRAAARVEELAAEGYIRDEAERERLIREVYEAGDWRQLNAVLEGVDPGPRGWGDENRRASEADRKDAARRLHVHGSMSHLDEKELDARLELVDNSKTPADIAKVFDDLPALGAVSKGVEPRISTHDKSEALEKLRQAHAEGRIEDEEYGVAMSQVAAARTRSELEAAFRCLPGPTGAEVAAQAARRTAAFTTRMAAEGSRRARKVFLRLIFAVAALAIGIALLIAGVGTGALLCFAAAILLFVGSAVALVSRG